MNIEEQIKNRLDEVLVPQVVRSIVNMNLIREIAVKDGKASITMASTGLTEDVQKWLKQKVEESTAGIPGLKGVDVQYTEAKPSEINKIKNVIAVMSGKGGVGKSLVTGLIATALRRMGYETGILDADITGPSIPKMFGIVERPGGSDTGILPVTSKTGIELISINLFLPNEDEAVIWRGPLIGKAIKQFWEDVVWGDLDYLVVDLPPGTADAPLTVMQTLPITGAVIVFTPQDLTAMIVKKAVNMCQQMHKDVLGVVENMSYLYIPELKKKLELFGKSKGEEMSSAAKAPLLATIPIDPELAKLCDLGHIERYDSPLIEELGTKLKELTAAK